MNRAFLIAGAIALGLASAVLFFPSEETGDSLAADDRPEIQQAGVAPSAAGRGSSAGTTASAEQPGIQAVRSTDEVVAEIEAAVAAGTKHPKQAAIEIRRAQPDAVAAGQHAATWTGIRQQLVSTNMDKAVITEISALVRDMRAARMRPDAADFATLDRREKELVAELRREGVNDEVEAIIRTISQ